MLYALILTSKRLLLSAVFIGLQQRLMRREGFQIAVYRLQSVEWRFAAQGRAGGFYRLGTVHAHESVQVLQWLTILFLRKKQEGLQAAVVVGALGREH